MKVTNILRVLLLMFAVLSNNIYAESLKSVNGDSCVAGVISNMDLGKDGVGSLLLGTGTGVKRFKIYSEDSNEWDLLFRLYTQGETLVCVCIYFGSKQIYTAWEGRCGE